MMVVERRLEVSQRAEPVHRIEFLYLVIVSFHVSFLKTRMARSSRMSVCLTRRELPLWG